MGIKARQKIQLGKESVAGTAVAATTIWRSPFAGIQDEREVKFVDEQIGITVPTDRSYIPRLDASLSMPATAATFEQLPYIFEAGLKLETPAQDGSGTDYIYEYEVGTTAVNTVRTYTIETGDDQQAEEMEYSFVTEFTLSGEAGDAVMMSANWMGRQATDTTFTGGLSIPAVDEILTQKGLFYIDDDDGAHGDTAVSNSLLSWTLNVTTGWKAKYPVDTGNLYFGFNYFDIESFEATLECTWEHDSNATAEKTNWRNETTRLIRLELPGPAVATGGTTYSNKTLLLDLTGKWESFDSLDSQDGNSIVNATLRAGYNTTAAHIFTATVVNELSALV